MEQIAGTMQPGEVEAALDGLHEGPGELRDADVGDAGGDHALDIVGPERLGGLVRVVIDAKEEGQGWSGGLGGQVEGKRGECEGCAEAGEENSSVDSMSVHGRNDSMPKLW